MHVCVVAEVDPDVHLEVMPWKRVKLKVRYGESLN